MLPAGRRRSTVVIRSGHEATCDVISRTHLEILYKNDAFWEIGSVDERIHFLGNSHVNIYFLNFSCAQRVERTPK